MTRNAHRYRTSPAAISRLAGEGPERTDSTSAATVSGTVPKKPAKNQALRTVRLIACIAAT